MDAVDSQEVSQEAPTPNVFIAPSINEAEILDGLSHTHHCPIPTRVLKEPAAEIVLGIDEAGRGPVLGRSI